MAFLATIVIHIYLNGKSVTSNANIKQHNIYNGTSVITYKSERSDIIKAPSSTSWLIADQNSCLDLFEGLFSYSDVGLGKVAMRERQPASWTIPYLYLQNRMIEILGVYLHRIHSQEYQVLRDM